MTASESEKEPLPAGVVDALSVYHVGASRPQQPTGQQTSGVDRETIQEWLRDILTDGSRTDAGVAVNSRTAMTYPPCYYAIQKVAGHLGMMSWSLRQRVGHRKTREATDHPAYRLLKHPNELYGASVFTEVVSGHTIYRGNGRAYIERDAYMRPRKLWVLLPDQTRTVIVDGEKWHLSRILIDSETGETRTYRFHDRDVLHVMGFSPDGITGYDVLHLARQSIGLGLAAERQQARHFSRNAIPGLLLSAPKDSLMNDEKAREFLKDFRAAHEGLDNAGKTALLRFGITAQQLSHTGKDSQTIESRQFQREEMALWWMLESMLGEDGTSYNSEEQRQLAYLKGLLGKLKKRWEEERDRKLLTELEKDRDSHYHQLNPGSLLQADMQTTLTTLQTGIAATIYSPNDAREILGLDAYEGGDQYGNPNTTSNTGGDPPEPKPDDGSAETAALQRRLQAAYQATLTNLAGVEARRVRGAIESAKGDHAKFLDWAQRFYAENEWPKTFARTWQEFGGDAADAQAIIDQHRETLVETASAADVDDVLRAWLSRPAAWAATLAGIDENA